jgi:hypothetical protein
MASIDIEPTYIGQRVWVDILNYDLDGELADIETDDEMTIVITGGGDAAATKTLGAGEIENTAVGTYRVPIVPTEAGWVNWRAFTECVHETNGINEHSVSAQQGSFYVTPSNVD